MASSVRPDQRAEPGTRTDLNVVGRPLVHGEFLEKVEGSLLYADDWNLPGMLYARIVRAQIPSARILSIDTAEAEGVPGVVAIMTAKDVPNNAIIEETSGLGVTPVAMPMLAHHRIRYHGEPVALVAAETPEAAEEAAELVVVDYEEVPGVFGPEEALAPGAPAVHERGNTLVEWTIRRGDAESALRTAPVVVEETYRSQRVDHAYLEPEAGVGWLDADGVVTIRVATQVIEHAREIAHVLGVPQNRVRIIGTYMGGGFGGKEDMTVEAHVALLVWRTRRPVKMVWSRQESLLARPKRHPFVMHYRTGAAADGTILAQRIRIVADGGAYPLLSPRVLFAAAVTAAGPYRSPDVDIVSTAAFTNTVPSSAMRGFGAMQVVLAYEGQMDRLAEAVGVSKVEIRRRNFNRQGDLLPTGEPLDTYVALPETLQAALDGLGPAGPGPQARNGKLVGRGFACNFQPYGRARFFADRASCWLGLEPDGSLTIRAGVTDLGGGQAASLAQIASEVLGVPVDRITVYIADSALTPLTGGTFATRQLYMSGNAVLKAARELRDQLAPVAVDLLGVGHGHALEFAGGEVRSAPDGPSVGLADLAREATRRGITLSHLSTFHAETGEFDPRSGQGKTFPDYTYGTHAAEVEVDPGTGQVCVRRYVASHDVGRAINPLRVEGQIQGGVAQGIGYALSEEIRIVDGTNLTGLFADYLVPVATDLPDIEAIVLELGEGKGPFGARGIGEPAISPCAATIASAVADAIGVRFTTLPITAERVLEALDSRTQPGSTSSPALG